jgi:hypothetical protein
MSSPFLSALASFPGYLKKMPQSWVVGKSLSSWRRFVTCQVEYHQPNKKRPGNRPLFYQDDMPPHQNARQGGITPGVLLTEGSFC